MIRKITLIITTLTLISCGSPDNNDDASDNSTSLSTPYSASGNLSMELLGHEDVANGEITVNGKSYEVVVYREDFEPAGIYIDWDSPIFEGHVTATINTQNEIIIIGADIYKLTDIEIN